MSLRDRRREHMISMIVDAAARLFGEQGYHGTSMDDVAKALDCAPATLYGYFRGKDELWARVVKERFAEYFGGATWALGVPGLAHDDEDSRPPPPQGFDARLAAYVDNFRSFAKRHQAFFRVMVQLLRCPEPGTMPDPQEAEQLRLWYRDSVAGLIELGLAEGRVRAGTDSKHAAVSLIALLHSHALTWLLEPDRVDLDTAFDAALDLFRRGVLETR
jgi:AcrR family transcriptional regulator